MFVFVAMLAVAATSVWSLTTENDPITDVKSVALSLAQPPSVLRLECDARAGYSVLIQTDHWLGGVPALRPTVVRFDADAPTQGRWGYANRAALLQGDGYMFVQNLRLSKKLVVRLVDRDEIPYDVTFNLAGAVPQISKLAAACAAIGGAP